MKKNVTSLRKKKFSAKPSSAKKTGAKRTVTKGGKPSSSSRLSKGASAKKKTAAPAKRKSRPSVYGKRFLDEMTKNLLLMKETLHRGVSESIQRETDHLRFDVGDFYDQASDDRQRNLALTFSERERTKLFQIEQALKRIREGNYGICEMTGEKIGEDRLRVMPFTKFSIEAQEEIEKGD